MTGDAAFVPPPEPETSELGRVELACAFVLFAALGAGLALFGAAVALGVPSPLRWGAPLVLVPLAAKIAERAERSRTSPPEERWTAWNWGWAALRGAVWAGLVGTAAIGLGAPLWGAAAGAAVGAVPVLTHAIRRARRAAPRRPPLVAHKRVLAPAAYGSMALGATVALVAAGVAREEPSLRAAGAGTALLAALAVATMRRRAARYGGLHAATG